MFSDHVLELPALPYKENGWDIFVTQRLMNLKIVNHDKIWVDRKAMLPKISNNTQSFDISFFSKATDNPIVPWDGFKIQDINSAVKRERLYTKHLGPCYALCAQVYHLHGELSHIAVAHCYLNVDLPSKFLQKIAEITENKYSYINLFVCGGNDRSKFMHEAIISSLDEIRDVRVFHDISFQLYKPVCIEDKGTSYFGSIGIAEAGFDDNFHPRICVDIQVEGLKLENLFSQSTENHYTCSFSG